jgi:hypothetical protein
LGGGALPFEAEEVRRAASLGPGKPIRTSSSTGGEPFTTSASDRFAAETEKVIAEAGAKRLRKGCDWIVANDVSGDVMGGNSTKCI